MECRDHYVWAVVELAFAGEDVHFEAVGKFRSGVAYCLQNSKLSIFGLKLNVFGFFFSDETGIHPITEEYAAMCGYTASVLPLSGLVELRSSYFSCHTENKVKADVGKNLLALQVLFIFISLSFQDGVFKLNFNLLVTHDGHLVRYNFNKTCTPAAAWSPREITCEVNYMEVSTTSTSYYVQLC